MTTTMTRHPCGRRRPHPSPRRWRHRHRCCSWTIQVMRNGAQCICIRAIRAMLQWCYSWESPRTIICSRRKGSLTSACVCLFIANYLGRVTFDTHTHAPQAFASTIRCSQSALPAQLCIDRPTAQCSAAARTHDRLTSTHRMCVRGHVCVCATYNIYTLPIGYINLAHARAFVLHRTCH